MKSRHSASMCTRIVGTLVIWAIAQTSATAHAQSTLQAPNVWYRSADGCPDGDAFVQRLRERKVEAKLATAGDRIDFVVTVGGKTHGFSGRLERQTAGGTVAIRDFEAESCEQVADALAMTLTLSMTPEAAPDEPPRANPANEQPEPTAGPARTPKRAVSVASHGFEPTADRAQTTTESRPSAAWSIGAQALAATGIAPEWLPGVGLFVQWSSSGPGLIAPGFRAAAMVSRSSADTIGGELETTLLAGRFEGCPLRLASSTLTLRPCVGLEAGVFHADFSGAGGKAATATWAAVLAHPRLEWKLADAMQVDAHAGILVPFTRHDVVLANDSAPLHETAAVGLQAGVGLAYRWP